MEPNGDWDVFISRLDATGRNLEWSTFIGKPPGQGEASISCAYGIDVHIGDVFVAGYTTIDSMPTTPGLEVQDVYQGAGDGFALRLKYDGTAVVWCTYLGGDQEDAAMDIVVDQTGRAYVTGFTHSSGTFPITTGVVEPTNLASGNVCGFVCKLNPTATVFNYSTFLATSPTGNVMQSYGMGIDLDTREENAYRATVVGDIWEEAGGADMQTPGGFQTTNAGNGDAFVLQLNSNATAYLYGSYYGHDSGEELGRAIDVSDTGEILITGGSASRQVPVGVLSPIQPFNSDAASPYYFDAFVARINPGGTPSSLSYSSFHGGKEANDIGYSIRTDSTGRNSWIVGRTESEDFPVTLEWQNDLATGGQPDAFLFKVTAGAHPFSTYLGGPGHDEAYGIAVDSTAAYIVGRSSDGESSSFYAKMDALDAGVLPGYDKTNAGGGTYTLSTWAPDPRPDNVFEPPAGMDAFVLKVVLP